jgi:YfiH family protein
MSKELADTIEFLTFGLLNKQKDIVHFISTRKGGVSSRTYASLNLSLKVDDNPEHIMENRKRLAAKIGIETENLIIPDQCHTDNVQILTKDRKYVDLSMTDALITNAKGICLCILVADCVPILLYDPKKKLIAAVHAGWRGTVSRIVSRTLEHMIKILGSKPENILAGIGPAISQQNYEVGNEVADRFEFLFSDHPEITTKKPETGKTHIDLQSANRVLLLRAGLSEG